MLIPCQDLCIVSIWIIIILRWYYMKNRKGKIYIIKNKINEKVYIGQTTMTLNERFRCHLKPSTCKTRGSYKLYNAINKYGAENFYCELLCETDDLESLNHLEMYYIDKYDSYDNGYNSTRGGDCKEISKIQDIQLFLKLFNEGKTWKEIGEVFGVCKETAKRTGNSLGLDRKIKPITREQIIDNMHLTNIKMAEKFNVSTATITRYFKRYGIKRGKGCNNHLNENNKPKISKEDLLNNLHLTNKEIAKKFNVANSTVSNALKRHNIKKNQYRSKV